LGTMVCVYRIEDPSVWIHTEDSTGIIIPNVDGLTTVRQFKQYMEAKTGIPPERQRYHGVSNVFYSHSGGRARWRFHFHTPEILKDGDQLIERTLWDLSRRVDRIKSENVIGLVILPAGASAPEGEEDEPRVIRQVDAVEERIAAGRANAIEIGDESEFNDNDDRRGPLPQKRQHRSGRNERTGEANENDEERDEEAWEANQRDDDGNGEGGGDGPVGEGTGRNNENVAAVGQEGDDDGDEENGNGEDAEEGMACAGGEFVGDGAAMNAVDDPDAAEPGTVPALAIAAAAVPASADVREPAVSQLRRWLRTLDADGNVAGRFERYAPALEHQFDSLAELALIPETEGAWTRTVQACSIYKVGDKVMLMRAIRRLPRPV